MAVVVDEDITHGAVKVTRAVSVKGLRISSTALGISEEDDVEGSGWYMARHYAFWAVSFLDNVGPTFLRAFQKGNTEQELHTRSIACVVLAR